MESTILKYLSKNYKPKSFDNMIYDRWDNNAKVYGSDLISEVTNLFNINYGEAGELIERWVYSLAPAFLFHIYWETKKPIFRTVIAQLVATELVDVQPMNGPSGIINYFEPQMSFQQAGDLQTDDYQFMGYSLMSRAAATYKFPDNFPNLSITPIT